MKRRQQQCGELLALGKVARAETFLCGHIVLTFDSFKVGFSRDDFYDFANTIAMASMNLACRDKERAEWGLYMN
ncbi:MAG TPA: hypothetical protein PLY93_07355 [Turneriella sp.]|nr:hypothetical protein [Turneriella sp.]